MARFELVLMGIAVGLAAGCAPADYGAICEEAIGCFGGNEKDIDACVRSAELQEERADIIGCGEEFDDFAACTEERGQCLDRNLDGIPEWSTASSDGVVDLCQAENENLGSCFSGDSGSFDPFFEFD